MAALEILLLIFFLIFFVLILARGYKQDVLRADNKPTSKRRTQK